MVDRRSTVPPLWSGAIAVSILLAVVLGVSATLIARDARRPIGEGELLAADARTSAERVVGLVDAELLREMRSIRNDLEIEAVTYVSGDGAPTLSTSGSVGPSPVLDPILGSAMERGVFAAIATRTAVPLLLDGVVAWEAGSILYQALQPLDDGAIILTYDVSELLERRADATRIPPIVRPLEVASGLFVLITGALVAARSRAARTRREMAIEAGLLRRHAAVLEQANADLETARRETQRALELAEEKNRIRAEFVLMINHELRTPLTGVVTGTQLLAATASLDETERAILDDVLADGERLDGLIAQMLAVARVENRGLTTNPTRQPVATIVDRLATAHRSATIRTSEDVDETLAVTTDTTTLSQLVASLVDNALTHGASNVEVIITRAAPDDIRHEVGRRPESAVYVWVADDGPGIDHAFLPRAFEKFEKHSHSSGTGLGLYLARMMAESMGASIAVATSSEGTTVGIGLEVARIMEPAR